METVMARLCEDGAATFVILDREPLYDQSEIARIASVHHINPSQRHALWRTLEEAGRAFLDQQRLSRASRLVRVRQDLQLARRLASQLVDLSPQPGQSAADAPSVALTRCHLAALRDGERRAGAEHAVGLDDMREVLGWLTEVYDCAMSACLEPTEPEQIWRSALTEFYTRRLGRAWSREGDSQGERFLADCQIALNIAQNDPAQCDADIGAVTPDPAQPQAGQAAAR
jgi:hypothetical protein